jgi:hypothetical protein
MGFPLKIVRGLLGLAGFRGLESASLTNGLVNLESGFLEDLNDECPLWRAILKGRCARY